MGSREGRPYKFIARINRLLFFPDPTIKSPRDGGAKATDDKARLINENNNANPIACLSSVIQNSGYPINEFIFIVRQAFFTS
ncbi:MAG TPA: hypothetical protein DIC51_00505 [Coxiellaceae bacterium]|nr:hypothetical protein [Coxiellaceae bacterium]